MNKRVVRIYSCNGHAKLIPSPGQELSEERRGMPGDGTKKAGWAGTPSCKGTGSPGTLREILHRCCLLGVMRNLHLYRS